MAALNIEIDKSLKKALDHAVTERETTLKAAVAQAITAWIAANVPASAPNLHIEPQLAPAVVELPGPYAGLSDDQVWLVTNIIEILRDQPQAAIFRALENTIQLAVSEHRKTRPSPKPNAQTPGKSTHDRRRTGGT